MPYKYPEVAKVKRREYYLKNREKRLLWQKQYYEERREEISAKRKTRDYKELYQRRREKILKNRERYGKSEKGKSTRRKHCNERYRIDPEYLLKKKARDIARRLPLKDNCENCGTKEELKHHHPDYSKPREYQTLCYDCHGKVHGFRRGPRQ